MSSLNNTTDSINSGQPRKNYITTSAFNSDFYRYTTSVNPTTFITTGSLTAVTGATAANCPANRILRENGRRLYKDANPGVSTLLVGVYDSASGLSGFIDPNSPRFAVYNGEKSVYLDNGIDPNGGAADQGPPIYTRGSVTAGSGVNVTGGSLTLSGPALFIPGTPTTVAGTATAATLNLAVSEIFIHSTTVTGAVTYTIQNSAVGCIFYFAATCDATPRAISFTGGGTFVSSVTTLPASTTTLVTVIRTA